MSDKHQLIINYVPGEECRVAVMVNGKLDEFHSERADNVSHVGNIYVGRVTNVEPAISAAFVDFGLEEGGFLHVSDLHPRYFGDGEATERVGKKTPRRERPPIQDCLKRGQEIIVQVLKEGVGSKGPTLTSYLSIPGRYLVMMPQMDRVGVSRKVEDEDLRKRSKEILDQLDLPEGFGFILRTAGLERTKTELKRDLAYLVRLQKDMERKRMVGNKPRLLYSESDLLVRALRDMVTAETESIVIDHEAAVKRAARFMKIVAPRTVTKLIHFTGRAPIFHALGVEQQIRTMYAREVPLPSGGRLVIDETEALVAIDVNSGKSRSAGDSETNALTTNLEAADEICRQLRLRDLGGIVVNDLIDMRLAKHRKEVEGKFDAILKEDRARSTIAPISEFGILEMTRQRMRGSHESIHFHSCPHCHGRGVVQKPDSVAADAVRELAAVMDHDKVKRVELVVHPRVGSELLSSRRRALARLEKTFAKTIAVRLSEATQPDRYTIYAYEADGADIELDRLPRHRVKDDQLVAHTEPGLDEAIAEAEAETESADPADDFALDAAAEAADPDVEDGPDRADADGDAAHPIEMDPGALPVDEDAPNFGEGGRRGRGRRGGRGRSKTGGDRDAPPRTSDRPRSAQQPAPRPERARDGGRGGGGGSGGGPRHAQPVVMVNTPSGGSYEPDLPVPPQYAAADPAAVPGTPEAPAFTRAPGVFGRPGDHGDGAREDLDGPPSGSGQGPLGHDTHPDGEGGRRRRRRRGGRGRNRGARDGDGGFHGAPPADPHAPAAPRPPHHDRGPGPARTGFAGLAGAFRAEALSTSPQPSAVQPAAGHEAGGNSTDHTPGAEGSDTPAPALPADGHAHEQPGDHGPGGERRGGRRRRGRGGRGRGGGGGGGNDAPRIDSGAARNDGRPPAASPLGRDGTAAPTGGAPGGGSAGGPKFRPLYGSMRKLKPGERKAGGREE